MQERLRVVSVDSWDGLRGAVSDARTYLDVLDDEELWFRGIKRRSFELLPSLLRAIPAKSRTHDEVRRIETDLFFEFLAKARTGDSALDHWDVLFKMQHYRAPTRLLDWTEVLAVALHFCVSEAYLDPEDGPRVYLMNPYRWNERNTGFGRDLVWPRYFGYDSDEEYFYEYGELLTDDQIDWKKPVALYPPQRDPRLTAQRGFFTIHGTDPRALEKIDPGELMAVDLTEAAVEDIRGQLELWGVDEYTLFPDLEGLARKLKRRYKLV